MSSNEEFPALIPSTGKLSLRTPSARGQSGALATPEHAKQKPATGKRKKKPKAVGATSQAILAFLFMAVVMGALLYDQVGGTKILAPGHYNVTRLAFVLGAYVVLLLEAFSHSMLHGVLCLFFPPYVLVYGLFVADGGASRGFTFALCVFFGVEMYFKPKDSFVREAASATQGAIDAINHRISGSKRSSDFMK